jgi:hypothetical protein
MQTINSEQEDGECLKDSVFDKSFEKWWPDFERNVSKIIREHRPEKPRPKTTEENHNDIMGMLRGIRELRVHDLTQNVAEDVFVNIYANIDAAFASSTERIEQIEALLMVARNVEYVHMRVHKSRQHAERAVRLLERLTREKDKLESEARLNQLRADDDVQF